MGNEQSSQIDGAVEAPGVTEIPARDDNYKEKKAPRKRSRVAKEGGADPPSSSPQQHLKSPKAKKTRKKAGDLAIRQRESSVTNETEEARMAGLQTVERSLQADPLESTSASIPSQAIVATEVSKKKGGFRSVNDILASQPNFMNGWEPGSTNGEKAAGGERMSRSRIAKKYGKNRARKNLVEEADAILIASRNLKRVLDISPAHGPGEEGIEDVDAEGPHGGKETSEFRDLPIDAVEPEELETTDIVDPTDLSNRIKEKRTVHPEVDGEQSPNIETFQKSGVRHGSSTAVIGQESLVRSSQPLTSPKNRKRKRAERISGELQSFKDANAKGQGDQNELPHSLAVESGLATMQHDRDSQEGSPEDLLSLSRKSLERHRLLVEAGLSNRASPNFSNDQKNETLAKGLFQNDDSILEASNNLEEVDPDVDAALDRQASARLGQNLSSAEPPLRSDKEPASPKIGKFVSRTRDEASLTSDLNSALFDRISSGGDKSQSSHAIGEYTETSTGIQASDDQSKTGKLGGKKSRTFWTGDFDFPQSLPEDDLLVANDTSRDLLPPSSAAAEDINTAQRVQSGFQPGHPLIEHSESVRWNHDSPAKKTINQVGSENDHVTSENEDSVADSSPRRNKDGGRAARLRDRLLDANGSPVKRPTSYKVRRGDSKRSGRTDAADVSETGIYSLQNGESSIKNSISKETIEESTKEDDNQFQFTPLNASSRKRRRALTENETKFDITKSNPSHKSLQARTPLRSQAFGDYDDDAFDLVEEQVKTTRQKPFARKTGSKSRPARTSIGGLGPSEMETIAEEMITYREAHDDMTQAELNDIVQGSAYDGKELWDQLNDALPGYKRPGLMKAVRRKYHNFESRGTWTAEQEEEMLAAYKLYPNKWKAIGEAIGRFPEDVRDKYRNYSICGDKLVHGSWDGAEEELLREIVKELLEKVRADRAASPTEYSKRPDIDLVDWQVVSSEMGHTRSRLQCRNKWGFLIGRKNGQDPEPTSTKTKTKAWRIQRAEQAYRKMTRDDKLYLLSEMDKHPVASEYQVPWHEIGDGEFRKQWPVLVLKVTFRILRQGIAGNNGMEVSDIIPLIMEQIEQDPEYGKLEDHSTQIKTRRNRQSKSSEYVRDEDEDEDDENQGGNGIQDLNPIEEVSQVVSRKRKLKHDDNGDHSESDGMASRQKRRKERDGPTTSSRKGTDNQKVKGGENTSNTQAKFTSVKQRNSRKQIRSRNHAQAASMASESSAFANSFSGQSEDIPVYEAHFDEEPVDDISRRLSQGPDENLSSKRASRASSSTSSSGSSAESQELLRMTQSAKNRVRDEFWGSGRENDGDDVNDDEENEGGSETSDSRARSEHSRGSIEL